MKEIKLISVYRAIAAISVMLYHYTVIPSDWMKVNWGGVILERGGIFGVGLLFMITGFLGALNIDNKNPVTYIKKRFVRLWPTYACCILITSIVLFVFWPEKKPSVLQILLNFTM